jgi:hypothetical protein
VTHTVANPGNVRLQAQQSVYVSGPLGILGHTDNLPDLPELLPGSTLTRTVSMRGIWPATHLAATVRLQPVASTDDPPIEVANATGSGTTWAGPGVNSSSCS